MVRKWWIPLSGLMMAAVALSGVLPDTASAQRQPGIEILPDSVIVPPVPLEDEGETFRIRVDDGDEQHSIQISVGSRHRGGGDGVVRFGENITIHEGEFVDGDVVSMGGNITVVGRVSGDVVSIGGNVILEPGASVDGDVVCIGGSIQIGDAVRVDGDAVSVWGRMNRSDLSEVRGEVVLVGAFDGIAGLPIWGFGENSFLMDVWSLLRRLVWVAVMALIGFAIFQIFPSRMGRVTDIARDEGLKAFLVGIAGWVLWLPAFVALLITIVGIPIALLLIFLTPVMVLFGYLGVAAATGDRFRDRMGGGGVKRGMLAGLLALEGGVILAQVLKVVGTQLSILTAIAGVVGLIGYLVIFVAGTIGFGALILSRFRPRDTHQQESAPSSEPGGGAQPAFGGGTQVTR